MFWVRIAMGWVREERAVVMAEWSSWSRNEFWTVPWEDDIRKESRTDKVGFETEACVLGAEG